MQKLWRRSNGRWQKASHVKAELSEDGWISLTTMVFLPATVASHLLRQPNTEQDASKSGVRI
jgi:hypothetical protein